MDKETKTLIDFYDNKIKDLEDKNKEKQDKLDKIEKLSLNRMKDIMLSLLPNNTKAEISILVDEVLQIIKGEDK